MTKKKEITSTVPDVMAQCLTGTITFQIPVHVKNAVDVLDVVDLKAATEEVESALDSLKGMGRASLKNLRIEKKKIL